MVSGFPRSEGSIPTDAGGHGPPIAILRSGSKVIPNAHAVDTRIHDVATVPRTIHPTVDHRLRTSVSGSHVFAARLSVVASRAEPLRERRAIRAVVAESVSLAHIHAMAA